MIKDDEAAKAEKKAADEAEKEKLDAQVAKIKKK